MTVARPNVRSVRGPREIEDFVGWKHKQRQG